MARYIRRMPDADLIVWRSYLGGIHYWNWTIRYDGGGQHSGNYSRTLAAAKDGATRAYVRRDKKQHGGYRWEEVHTQRWEVHDAS